MIRFNVFHKGQPIGGMPLNSTYLFGQDEIPVRSQLEFNDGQLRCIRHGNTAVGVVTLWPVEGFGSVMLQTTRLPERDEPYNLNVEIARGRLLRISQKREEWGITNLALTKEHHELIDKALDKFVDALCRQGEPQEAAVLADESLALAMQAGERISLTHAGMFLDRRGSNQGFGRHCFGCCFDMGRVNDPKYLQNIKDNFHFVTVPVSWRQIEPQEHKRNFELLDKCINWLSRHRIAAKVGPLIDFSAQAVPDWLYIWENDFEQVRDMAYDFISAMVERYHKKVQAWDVVSGLNVNNCFKFSFDEIIEMTRSVALAAKRSASRSLVLVEIAQPWGDYYAHNQLTIPPMIYLDLICQGGINFDGLGVKLSFGRSHRGMQTRDILELSCLLDRVGLFGKPVHLSCVGVPSQTDTRDSDSPVNQGGCWHGPWSDQSQAQWLEQVYQIALSKPFIETITWRDLTDRDDGILQHGGLLRKDYTAKPAFEKMRLLKEKMVGLKRTK